MNFTACFELTESYFRESYQEWLNSRSRWRRWERHLGALSVSVAVPLFLVPGFVIVGSAAFGFGCSQIVDFYFSRKRWLKQRVAARAGNPHGRMEMVFDDSGIAAEGPTSEGKMSWSAVKAVYPTEKGLFLSVGGAMSIYIPNTGMSSLALRDFAVEMAGRQSVVE